MKDIEELYNYLDNMLLMLNSENADISMDGIRETTTSVILKDIISRMGTHEDKNAWIMEEENNYGMRFVNKKRMLSLAGQTMQMEAFHLANDLLKENLLVLDNEELRDFFINILVKDSKIYFPGFQSEKEKEKEFYKDIEEKYKEYGSDINEFKQTVLKGKIAKSMEKKEYDQVVSIMKAYPEIALKEISFLLPTGGFGEAERHTLEEFSGKVSSGKVKINKDSIPCVIEIQKALLKQSLAVNKKQVNAGIKRI